MIAVDTNILIYAWAQESPWHQQAAELIERLELGSSEWAIPDPCLSEYYAAVRNPKRVKTPATSSEARGQIEYWLALPQVVILCEFASDDKDYWACFRNPFSAGLSAGVLAERVAAEEGLAGAGDEVAVDD